MANEAVDLLQQYIRLNTSNPPGNEYLASEFFQRIFYDSSIPYKTYELDPGRVSIRAEIEGSGNRAAVILLHHEDVISARREEWSFDPFGGEIIDGHICGRGALDTKSLGIMQLMAFLEIKKRGYKLKRGLIFLATADEEAGGEAGVGRLLAQHPADFRANLVLNEGGYVVSGMAEGRVVAMISPGEKGPCWLKLKRRGQPGHGSTPHGQNALEKLTRAVNRLLDYNPQPRVTAIPAEYFRRLAAAWDFLKPYVDDGRDETLLKLLNETGFIAMPQIRAMLRNTVSLNGLHSGDKVNVIPSYAEAEVDTRLLPGQDVEAWLKEVKTLLDDDEIEIERVSTHPGNSSDMDTADYRMIEEALSHHYPGSVTAPYLMLGTTDSRFFRDRGMTSYGFCPAVIPMEHMKSIHGFDEKISVDSFLKGVEVYRDMVRRLCM